MAAITPCVVSLSKEGNVEIRLIVFKSASSQELTIICSLVLFLIRIHQGRLSGGTGTCCVFTISEVSHMKSRKKEKKTIF